MAASAPALSNTDRAAPAGFQNRWAKLLAPSYFDFFVVALVVWLFGVGAGWNSLMLDGDAGWHIRTGEHILANGSVPQTDLFSWSKSGEPWFAWEWLSDVVWAVLHARFGLAGIAAAAGVIICASAAVLLRHMLQLGANTFGALLITLLFVGAGSIHHHARPHVFTLLFFAIFVFVIERDRVSPGKWLWALVPFAALWTNMHGGFLAGVAYAGLITAGAAMHCVFSPARDWRVPLRYGLLTAGCMLASVINPYGVRLHAHIAEYLRSDFIKNTIQEFQSPVFRSEASLQYEAVLISGLICVGLLLWRRQYPEAFTVLYFAHMSLMSARHVPLYVIVAGPVIAMEFTRLWREWVNSQSRNSIAGILDQVSSDFEGGFRRVTVWCPLGLAAVILFTPADRWPKDFHQGFPKKMVAQYGDLIAASRVLSTDQWGDYLIYHLYPRQRVFVDGRSDFYGEALCKDYLSLMNATHKWESVLHRYGFNLILIPVKWPLSSVLKLSPKWRVVADDGEAILFSPAPSITAKQNPKQQG
jgi:hypothetical protein